MNESRIAVIGAGMAGLGAARTLRRLGIAATVFEKSRGPGGRCATRRVGDYFWDSGATTIVPRQSELGRVMREEISTDGLEPVARPVMLHTNLRPQPGDPTRAAGRFAYRDGIHTLPKRLAEGLDVRLQTEVEHLDRDGHRLVVNGERYDGIILTPPIPQTDRLLWTLGESRPFAAVRYRSCISIMLGYADDLPETAYAALLSPDQAHPLAWLSVESAKCTGRRPTLVLQMSREFSRVHYPKSDAELVDMALPYVRTLFGARYTQPDAISVMRWKYSQPEVTGTFGMVNPPGSRLIVASDGIFGGRLEDAYDSGVRAATMLAESLAIPIESPAERAA
ncbi:MAG: FAD-dependent oxidoreductase [Fimbriimonadaceae bacterium]|nr:FAD-dependent oxidoreductase [Fimbriimonadaceae bacterium]